MDKEEDVEYLEFFPNDGKLVIGEMKPSAIDKEELQLAASESNDNSAGIVGKHVETQTKKRKIDGIKLKL